VSAERYYVSDERDHHTERHRVIDRERQAERDFEWQDLYGIEYVLAQCDTLEDARAVRDALANADAPVHAGEPSYAMGEFRGRVAAAMVRERDGVATDADNLVLDEYRKAIRS